VILEKIEKFNKKKCWSRRTTGASEPKQKKKPYLAEGAKATFKYYSRILDALRLNSEFISVISIVNKDEIYL